MSDKAEAAIAALDTLADDTFALLGDGIRKQVAKPPRRRFKKPTPVETDRPAPVETHETLEHPLLTQISFSQDYQTAMKQRLVDMFHFLVNQYNEDPGGVQSMSPEQVAELVNNFNMIICQYVALEMLIQNSSWNKMDVTVKDFIPMFTTLRRTYFNELMPFANDTWLNAISPFDQQKGRSLTIVQIQEAVRDTSYYSLIPFMIGLGHGENSADTSPSTHGNAANAGGLTQNPRDVWESSGPQTIASDRWPSARQPCKRRIVRDSDKYFSSPAFKKTWIGHDSVKKGNKEPAMPLGEARPFPTTTCVAIKKEHIDTDAKNQEVAMPIEDVDLPTSTSALRMLDDLMGK